MGVPFNLAYLDQVLTNINIAYKYITGTDSQIGLKILMDKNFSLYKEQSTKGIYLLRIREVLKTEEFNTNF